jgi:hypothetical protein
MMLARRLSTGAQLAQWRQGMPRGQAPLPATCTPTAPRMLANLTSCPFLWLLLAPARALHRCHSAVWKHRMLRVATAVRSLIGLARTVPPTPHVVLQCHNRARPCH